MSDPAPQVRIWIAASHHPSFLCGGWAYVRQAGGAPSGWAGGERQTTAERTELAGLAAALAELPAGAAVEVATPSARLAGAARWLAGAAGADAPQADLDLWARIVAAAKGRSVRIVRAQAAAKTPGAFCAAWAELARDKAKMTGAFSAAIPRPNLAKVEGV
jgi:ribonuclease HI